MYKIARERAKQRYRRKLAIDRLTRQGFIGTDGRQAFLTDSGRAAIDDTIGRIRNSLKTKKWDKKWRIVSYDIPEKFKHLRDAVRSILKRAGFVKLHHSLWIFPHECGELTSLIHQETKLQKYMVYGIVEKIENESKLKTLFSLS